MATVRQPKRRRNLSDALERLSDGDFWDTRSAEPGRAPVAAMVSEPLRPDDPLDRRHGPARQMIRASDEPMAKGKGDERRAPADGGVPLLLLRSRSARREVATGRIAVRVPADIMRSFNAVARLRREPRGVLFQRVLVGFLDRLEREGVTLIAELQRELGLGRELVVDEDVWIVTGEASFSDDESTSAERMVQMAHAVEVDVAQRFDDCAWRLEIAKDPLGRLVVAAFLWRFITQRPDLEGSLGFDALDIRTSASTSLRR